MHLLRQYGVELLPGASVDHIEESKVVVKYEGGIRELKADTVAMATGMRAKSDIVDALDGIVRYTWVVGDANRAASIMQAIHSGFQAAVEI